MMYSRHFYYHACMCVALPLLLASCQADKLQITAKEEYTREFLKQFGVPDSNNGWNAAMRVKAEISPSHLDGAGRVNVFTAWPTTPGSQLVASFDVPKTNFEFDIPLNTGFVYVQILDRDSRQLYGSYAEVKDGVMCIDGAVASRAAEVQAKPVYAYRLTDHPAMGTFPFNEDYNREFWKQTKIWKEPTADSGPENLDTTTDHIVMNQDLQLINYWPEHETVINSFKDAESNRISLSVKFVLSDRGDQDHRQFVFGNELIASGFLASPAYEEGKEYTLKYDLTKEQTQQFKDGLIIKGTGVTLKEISYRNLPWEVTYSGDRGNFSDVFNLYGLATVPVSNYTDFRNNALGPDHSLDVNGYSAADLVSLVGRESGVMHEEIDENPPHQCNLIRFRDQLQPDAGVDYIMAEDGPVTVDYFFGSASAFNCLGYFYYSDEEAKLYDKDPDHFDFVKMLLKKPKFILIYRACPGYNIHVKRTEGSDWEEQSKLADFIDSEGNPTENLAMSPLEDEGKDKKDNWEHCMEFTDMVDNAERIMMEGGERPEYPRMRSANYRLYYYPDDAFEPEENSPTEMYKLKDGAVPSTIFPKGTHIAFFVINGGQYAFRREGKAGFQLDSRRISFSRPFLNKYLGNVFNAMGHSHRPDPDPNMPSINNPGAHAEDAWTPFVTYNWAGRVTMGVEDYFARTEGAYKGGDHDMNDMIFSVNGKFERERPKLDPGDPELPSWIVACEDLGGTYDFDFNDVVFGVSHVAGSETATLTALASGGTLPVNILSKYPSVNPAESEAVEVGGKTMYRLIPEGSNDGEFHSWWGNGRPHTVPINVDGGWKAGATVAITVPEDFTVSSGSTDKGNEVDGDGNMGGFRVMVRRDGKDYNVIVPPSLGHQGDDIESPQMFLVDKKWNWPVERQHIGEVYNGFFKWEPSWWKAADGPSKGNVVIHKWSPGAIQTINR